MTITSAHNENLKEIRKLAGRRWRDKLQRFVAEGEDLLDAADAAGWEPLVRYVVDGSERDGIPVAAHVLAEISQLGSGTRALAVYAQKWAPAPVGPRCLVLWGVGDPGNVGTALRSALAFGAPCVALGPGTVDPYGHKAVRASMGALFTVPVVRVRDPRDLPGPRVALVAGQGRPLAEVAPSAGSLLIGAEREGLPDDVVSACDEIAHVAIAGDSLNAAMAATVALYEAARSGVPTSAPGAAAAGA